MVNVLFDTWLYLDMDGRPTVCGQEETTRLYKSRLKAVSVAFIDATVKPVSQLLLESAFASDHLVQHERLSGNMYQAIGALKTDIERIHRYFKPVPVVSLVPYAVAIRAFLNGRELLLKDKAVIFLDDLKTQAVLTIIEGTRLTTPRRISMRDPAYLISEIRRHQKHYMSQKEDGIVSREIAFIMVSNNREWLTAFTEQGLFTSEDIVHVDHACPVLEGLKNAKFAMHFALPEEILKQKRSKALWRILRSSAAAVSMAVLGAVVWAGSIAHQQGLAAQLAEARQEHQRVTGELTAMDQKKFTSFLRRGMVDYGRLYHDFVSGIPAGYMIRAFQMKRSDDVHWQFWGVIYPGQDNVIAHHFRPSGLLAEASSQTVVVQERLGQKITVKGGGDHE